MIELLLYAGLSSVLLISVSVFMSALLESRVKNQTIAEVEQQGLQAMQIITQTIRNAESINNAPSQGSLRQFLSLNTYSEALNPTVFDLSDGVIRVAEGAESAATLTNSRVIASEFAFQIFSRGNTPGAIRVQFALSYANNFGRNEYNYSKTFIGSASLWQP